MMKEIVARVEANGGLAKVTLGELRDEVGADRLGKWVLRQIVQGLEGNGLGYYPSEILDPEWNDRPRQHEEVRVFKKGTAIAEVVEAVEEPSERGDSRLIELAASDASETLDKIRSLVCG